jgi:hypothetical protein
MKRSAIDIGFLIFVIEEKQSQAQGAPERIRAQLEKEIGAAGRILERCLSETEAA